MRFRVRSDLPSAVFLVSAVVVTCVATPGRAADLRESCVECHKNESPAIVAQWQKSSHAKEDVSCLDCHQAANDEPDAHEHYKATIATIVSPKDCGQCHGEEAEQFAASHHARGAQFTGSLDNLLGVAVEGAPAAILGCQQCHGSVVKVTGDGKLDPTTWPNTGIGRVNPDGSKGSCSACHARHGFSAAQSRQPENCGRCHMGPDHPEIEIYKESKHGILFEADRGEMNLKSRTWVLGKDYSAAPTCATCHMSANTKAGLTHDAGARISWTLRPVISKKLPQWEEKRAEMQKACTHCHSGSYVRNFYKQFDAAVEIYNEKFARPAQQVMDRLYAEKLLTRTPFDEKIEWTFFELWHHEGRRARHGAAMMGPDFTQWHGFYEVAKHFYFKFLPEAEELKKGISEKALEGEYHRWRKGLSKEEMEQLFRFYRNRYGAENEATAAEK